MRGRGVEVSKTLFHLEKPVFMRISRLFTKFGKVGSADLVFAVIIFYNLKIQTEHIFTKAEVILLLEVIHVY